ncbi:MAG: hypothetical protein JXQ72_14325 [Anaerolineae bacterium]|nr:hypothetical protein [Anaerolineae bacterium]
MTIPEPITGTAPSPDLPEAEEVVYCTVHANVETTLRCNRCGRPMCTRCAVRTPVGYRCKECVREQQDKFFDAQVLDYLIAAGVSAVISFFAAAFLSRLGWGFFIIMIAFFISSAVGGIIGRSVFRLTGKRRGRYTDIVVGTAVVVGALPFVLYNPIAIIIFIFSATSAAVGQFHIRL